MPSEKVKPSPDTVYHLTGLRKLRDIMLKGLEPNPSRGESETWVKMEKLLDGQRPQALIDMGISRADAVYAHPDVDMVGSRSAMGAYRTRTMNQDTSIALGVEVEDPDKVLVCDADYIGDVTHNLLSGEEETAKKYAARYWNEAVTLADFRRFYTSTYEPTYRDTLSSHGARLDLRVHHVRKDDAPRTLPYIYVQPEVLIPGPVNPDRLEWAASNAHRAAE